MTSILSTPGAGLAILLALGGAFQDPEIPATSVAVPLGGGPILCLESFTEEESALRSRLCVELSKALLATETIDGGLRFSFAADTAPGPVLRWVELERRCCPFLSFALVLPPSGSSLELCVVGRSEARSFIESTFPRMLRNGTKDPDAGKR